MALPNTTMTTHRLLAALSGTTGAGAFAGALWGALLPPGGAASAWQSAALGAVLGGVTFRGHPHSSKF